MNSLPHTSVFGDAVVENHRHNPHHRHATPDQTEPRDGGDVGDGDSLLLGRGDEGISEDHATVTPTATALVPAIDPNQDPVGFIEAALVRLKDDVGVLAEEGVIHAFSMLHAVDMPAFLRLRQLVKLTNRDCSVSVLDKLVRQ